MVDIVSPIHNPEIVNQKNTYVVLKQLINKHSQVQFTAKITHIHKDYVVLSTNFGMIQIKNNFGGGLGQIVSGKIVLNKNGQMIAEVSEVGMAKLQTRSTTHNKNDQNSIVSKNIASNLEYNADSTEIVLPHHNKNHYTSYSMNGKLSFNGKLISDVIVTIVENDTENQDVDKTATSEYQNGTTIARKNNSTRILINDGRYIDVEKDLPLEQTFKLKIQKLLGANQHHLNEITKNSEDTKNTYLRFIQAYNNMYDRQYLNHNFLKLPHEFAKLADSCYPLLPEYKKQKLKIFEEVPTGHVCKSFLKIINETGIAAIPFSIDFNPTNDDNCQGRAIFEENSSTFEFNILGCLITISVYKDKCDILVSEKDLVPQISKICTNSKIPFTVKSYEELNSVNQKDTNPTDQEDSYAVEGTTFLTV